MAGKKNLQLTEGQKDCLRLVDDLMTSKQIARHLGISPSTVDQRLDAARRKLNAPSRKLAARIYLEIEARSLSESIIYYPDSVAPFDFIPMLSNRTNGQATDGEALRSKENGGNIRWGAVLSSWAQRSRKQQGPKTYADGLMGILEIGLISVIVSSAMILILAGLFRTLN
jgi:DNA-binding CsgD family transcriptional regulator